MNRARIIEMAKEAGFCFITQHDGTIHPEHSDLIERFAALVLAQAMEPAGSGAGHSVAGVGTGSYGAWRPMDSAPRDGSVFLALNHDGELWAAKYFIDKGPPRLAYRTNKLTETSSSRVHEIDGKRLLEELERDEQWSSCWTYWSRGYRFAPTHWMPLPDAPSRRSADTDRHGPNVHDDAAIAALRARLKVQQDRCLWPACSCYAPQAPGLCRYSPRSSAALASQGTAPLEQPQPDVHPVAGASSEASTAPAAWTTYAHIHAIGFGKSGLFVKEPGGPFCVPVFFGNAQHIPEYRHDES